MVMEDATMKTLLKWLISGFVAVALTGGVALAQDRRGFSQQELDQMLAPIALYPDALLSQILMAATYPVEVVQAARWRARMRCAPSTQWTGIPASNRWWHSRRFSTAWTKSSTGPSDWARRSWHRSRR